MATLIKDGRIAPSSPPPDLVLEPSDDPALLAGSIAEIRVIAVNFPKFGDGRGYSIARLLRERYGYQGELRAVGEVARDNLHFMAQCGFDAFQLRALGEVARDNLYFMTQCGFDAFQLREGEDAREALSAFGEFTASYQALPARVRR